MRYAKAVLVKYKTEDGLMELRPIVPLGYEYEADLESIRNVQLFNSVQRKLHEKEMVDVYEDGCFCRCMPTELLAIKSRVLQ